MKSKKVLGLDLGTNSIGWALIEEVNDTPARIIDGGVRIFIKSVEDKTPTPKNQARRNARLARRLIQRRTRRKQRVLNFLISKGLLPTDLSNNKTPETRLNEIGDPYELRKNALYKPLTPYQLGRVILHMASRRGFQSNRKTLMGNLIDDPDFREIQAEEALENGEDITLSEEQAKEEQGMKADIAELWKQIEENGSQTLGEYLAGRPFCERKRTRRTEREMYRKELSLIWKKQREYHKIAKDENFKKEIETLLFKQRPLKLAADRLGRCSLERQRPRARKAWPNVQRFRYWQDLNNLTYINRATGESVELGQQDKQTLAKMLEQQKTLSWPAIKKKLGLDKTVHFNLQESKKHITGSLTVCTVRKIIKEQWDDLSETQQNQLAEDLITISDKKALKNRLVKHWGIQPEQAIKLATVNLEQGIANLSTKAINKLLPHLQQGLELSKARVEAGYNYEQEDTEELAKLGLPPHIPNPVVSRALHETRKVINAIIHEYGKPDAIRIEMAREMKMTRKQKEKVIKQQNSNEKANESAKEHYSIIRNKNPELSQYPSKTDLIKYRLWEEAGKISVYSGKSISLTQLFTAQIEIDHILPFSRTLDDSFVNKVVCFESENKEKANRTPYEAWGGTERYDVIKQAIRSIKNKRKRDAFYVKELKKDDFLNSQLSDTRYISREILHYVKQLYNTKTVDKAVSVSKGNFTAWLRHEWGLNTIISPDDVKDRSDHRHHLLDAVVIALVDRRLYQRISKKAKYKGDASSIDLNLEEPWNGFRKDVQGLLGKTIISHAPRRRIAGALHKKTAYGIQQHPEKEQERVVYRKPLNDKFTETQIKKVIDSELKKKLLARLKEHEGDPKVAFSKDNPFIFLPDQGPVKHVRIKHAENFNKDSYLIIKDERGKPYKYYPFRNNHHVEILKSTEIDKNGDHKYKPEFVTAWEASQRLRRGNKSYVKTDHGDNWKLHMLLCINDMVTVGEEGEERKIYRVQKLNPDPKSLTLRKHTAVTLDNKNEELRKTISDLIQTHNMEKISIGTLGKY